MHIFCYISGAEPLHVFNNFKLCLKELWSSLNRWPDFSEIFLCNANQRKVFGAFYDSLYMELHIFVQSQHIQKGRIEHAGSNTSCKWAYFFQPWFRHVCLTVGYICMYSLYTCRYCSVVCGQNYTVKKVSVCVRWIDVVSTTMPLECITTESIYLLLDLLLVILYPWCKVGFGSWKLFHNKFLRL